MPDNKKQKNGFWSYLLWLALMSIVLASNARGEDRALLIGVGRYAHFTEKLHGINLDLDMMSETAQLMGFDKNAIKILENEHATTDGVYNAFENWLLEGLKPQDRVLIYFSGHGSQVPDENNDETDNFDEVLLLFDTTLIAENGRQSLSGVLHDDRFNKLLAQIKSRNIIVILDACHSGSATRSLPLTPRSIPVKDAQVKYFYYSPLLEDAGGSGRFDLMQPESLSGSSAQYVAITACRDDEKTVATSQGSLFTLGLRRVVRAAATTGNTLTPEEIQRQITRFIQEQVQSDEVRFHPQIRGPEDLRKRPLKLVALSGGNAIMHPNLISLTEKSHETIWIRTNKTCFEPGDVLEITVGVTEPGYLNVMSITSEDQSTVLFPNLYHPHNAVQPGKIAIPSARMEFELVCAPPLGSRLITAFLSRSPANDFRNGFKTKSDIMVDLSPDATRSLFLRRQEDWLAVGKLSVEIREEGRCE